MANLNQETPRTLEFARRLEALVVEFYDEFGPARDDVDGAEYSAADKIPNGYLLDWVTCLNWSVEDREYGVLVNAPGMRPTSVIGTLAHWAED